MIRYTDKLEFYHGVGGTLVRKQTGVVRSNCTDCLDRTNAVQAHLGLKVLTQQLAAMKLDDKETIVSRFQDGFKQMWVNNGNALSKVGRGKSLAIIRNMIFPSVVRGHSGTEPGREQADGRSAQRQQDHPEQPAGRGQTGGV